MDEFVIAANPKIEKAKVETETKDKKEAKKEKTE